ncbi:MAG: hypothetical protein ACI915_001503 [Gammaproteobacteria bacterium]|jgi:hypothetical protein
MTVKHARPSTALQKDHGFIALDDYDTRMYILPHLKDKSSLEAIIAEHREHPRGAGTKAGEPAPLHSTPLKRLIDKLRMVPQAGKHTIVETIPWKQYKLGVLPGRRGGVIEITDESYPTREDAEHAIFLKRLQVLLDAYGIDN